VFAIMFTQALSTRARILRRTRWVTDCLYSPVAYCSFSHAFFILPCEI